MKNPIVIIFCSFILLSSCALDSVQMQDQIEKVGSKEQLAQESNIINELGNTISTRFNTPDNYKRIHASKGSYGDYIRRLPLKPAHSKVLYYDGSEKPNYNVYDAVVDLDIGKRDLHQCADAVMRVRADYLWQNERFNEIHFNFTNGFRVDYKEWMKGKRISFKNRKTIWYQKTAPSNTYKDYWKYMELIFSYAGTLSLSKELKPVALKEMKIGDVFIWGGSPGHAVLVVDMAINEGSDETIFLLAQSYMPAQEIQVLKNPKNGNNPWYAVQRLKINFLHLNGLSKRMH